MHSVGSGTSEEVLQAIVVCKFPDHTFSSGYEQIKYIDSLMCHKFTMKIEDQNTDCFFTYSLAIIIIGYNFVTSLKDFNKSCKMFIP